MYITVYIFLLKIILNISFTGVQFDVRHYNALLEVHIYNELDFNPAEFLTSMEEQNCEPNKVY